eukprot:scaffold25916_cov69-Attheya_sp.AAC.1
MAALLDSSIIIITWHHIILYYEGVWILDFNNLDDNDTEPAELGNYPEFIKCIALESMHDKDSTARPKLLRMHRGNGYR